MAALNSGLAQSLANGKAILLLPLYGETVLSMGEDRETGLSKPYSTAVTLMREGTGSPERDSINPSARTVPAIWVNEGGRTVIYAVAVVEPGTWNAVSMRLNVRDGQMPETALKREVRESGFGKVHFAVRDMPEQVTDQRWAPPRFQTRNITADVCLTVHVQSGQCVNWGSQVVDQISEAVTSGHWYDVTRTIQRPGLQVSVHPSRPFAGVTVAAGEVVMLDGLYFKPPGVQFLDECAQVGGQTMACELNGFEYQVWPTNEAQFRQGVSALYGGAHVDVYEGAVHFATIPGAVAVFGQARYRPFTLSGKPGWRDEEWGQNMYVEAGK